MKFNTLILASGLSAVIMSTVVSAGDSSMPMNHGEMNNSEMSPQAMPQGQMNHDSMSKGMTEDKMFLETKEIDGYSVSFHVMAAEEGMSHGGSHNLMIKVDKGGAPVQGVQINSKVVYPDGTEESKPLMTMGDWQMAGYNLNASGKHQLMVLFKTADGKKHFGGLHYIR